MRSSAPLRAYRRRLKDGLPDVRNDRRPSALLLPQDYQRLFRPVGVVGDRALAVPSLQAVQETSQDARPARR